MKISISSFKIKNLGVKSLFLSGLTITKNEKKEYSYDDLENIIFTIDNSGNILISNFSFNEDTKEVKWGSLKILRNSLETDDITGLEKGQNLSRIFRYFPNKDCIIIADYEARIFKFKGIMSQLKSK